MNDDYYSLLGFLFPTFLLLSGFLGSARSVFSFLRRYNERIEDKNTLGYISKYVDMWNQQGCPELCYFTRYFTDAGSVLAGTHWIAPQLSRLLPTLPSLGVLTLSALLATSTLFLVAYQLLPSAARARSDFMVAPLHFFYSIYWHLFGWLGRLLYTLNYTYLSKFGYHKRFKIFSESQLQQFDKDETGLEEDEAEMVQNIFDLSTILVKEIFTPRVDMIAIEVNSSYEETIDLIKTHKFTRIPVYKENIDDIQGILHAKDLLGLEDDERDKAFQLIKIIRPAYFIPRSKKIDDLMEEFKVSHNHMAIVVDEYGGTAGLITLEDILEEIVGEIQDEDDWEDPVISKIDNDKYLIDPIITLDDFSKKLNIHFQPEKEVEIDTLGGYLQYLKGSIPREGDRIVSQGHSFEIIKMEGQSIEQVQLTLQES